MLVSRTKIEPIVQCKLDDWKPSTKQEKPAWVAGAMRCKVKSIKNDPVRQHGHLDQVGHAAGQLRIVQTCLFCFDAEQGIQGGITRLPQAKHQHG